MMPVELTIDQSKNYLDGMPRAQNCIDLFQGEWSSRFPATIRVDSGGWAGLFEDERIHWAADGLAKLGRAIRHADVLELGPLEGGHTAMLENMGAASITAVEANHRAFLKCLIAKEVLGLGVAHFLLGDALAHLERSDDQYDIGVVSGFLYHMREPIRLLELLSQSCGALYLWTHYFCGEDGTMSPDIRLRFGNPEERQHAGFQHTVYSYRYADALEWKGFCGGPNTDCNWLDRDDILGALTHFGYSRVLVREESNCHGPAMSIVAVRP